MKFQIDQMISSINTWLGAHDYRYIECNHVPDCLQTKNRKINTLWRTFFRLCPVNLRGKHGKLYPLMPQCNVAMLKAYAICNNREVIKKLYNRVLSLRSPKTQHFALKQGIRISVNLYENSADDPTPLNTVWFGQFLLDEHSDVIPEEKKHELLCSIADYIIEELGYIDHGTEGVYFFYGPTLKKEVYNASAIMSAFLIKVGKKYQVASYVSLGERGIRYICNRQNPEGSWFYAGPPSRPTIDCFHQSYILQALCSVKSWLSFDISSYIEKGVAFYRTMFVRDGKYVRPIRYDKRYTPKNTWLFVKVDGRDVAEALVFFSKYVKDTVMVNHLVQYAYDVFYNKKKGYMTPELFLYGKNRIPYIEFQSWFLYAFYVVKQSIKD